MELLVPALEGSMDWGAPGMIEENEDAGVHEKPACQKKTMNSVRLQEIPLSNSW